MRPGLQEVLEQVMGGHGLGHELDRTHQIAHLQVSLRVHQRGVEDLPAVEHSDDRIDALPIRYRHPTVDPFVRMLGKLGNGLVRVDRLHHGARCP